HTRMRPHAGPRAPPGRSPQAKTPQPPPPVATGKQTSLPDRDLLRNVAAGGGDCGVYVLRHYYNSGRF
ncbi:MAG TPA: hypothetical protein VJ810_41555, partial [Blastocatellia bacterium]|nr:hypothetical protein [Blastocatellia bacterium]